MELAAINVVGNLVFGTIGALKASFDIHKQIRCIIPPEEKRILTSLPGGDGERPAFRWTAGAPPIEAVYKALDMGRPLAENLLKRLMTHTLAVGVTLAAAWCLITTALLFAPSLPNWLALVVTAGGLFGACFAYLPSRRIGLHQFARIAERVQVLARFRATAADSIVHATNGLRVLAMSPLSAPEQEFLNSYVATRSLVTSLEANVLTAIIDRVRAPLFAGYKDKLQELVASALDDLVRAPAEIMEAGG